MEKVKNVLYDLTDFILVIIIVVIMFSVLTLKLKNSLSITTDEVFNSSKTENQITENEASNENFVIKPEIDSNEETTSTETEENTNNNSENQNTNNQNTNNQNIKGEDITINIKSGTTGYGIAKLLKEKNLIPDTQSFIKRTEELKLGAKLRSGKFTLNTKDSLDDIIYTLAGK